jgi:hypothetical protein
MNVAPVKTPASMPDAARSSGLSFRFSFSRRARLSAEAEAPPFELSVFPGKFVDLEKLILADAGEILAGIARGPPNLQIQDLGIFAEPDMLLQGGGAE